MAARPRLAFNCSNNSWHRSAAPPAGLRHAATGVFLCIIMVQSTLATNRDLSIAPRHADHDPKVFQRIEWLVNLAQSYSNPFDPEEIAIQATFRGPGGRTIVLPRSEERRVGKECVCGWVRDSDR